METARRGSTRRFVFVLAVFACAAAACGDDAAIVMRKTPREDGGAAGSAGASGATSAGASGATSGGAAGNIGGGSAGTGGAGGGSAGAGGAGGDPSATTRGVGYVTVISIRTTSTADAMLAGFYASAADRTPGMKPVNETLGPCVVTTYVPDGTAAGNRPSLSAGVITLTGGNGTSTITPMSGQYVLGATPAAGQPYFNPGQTLSFSAAGDVVPAFTATIVAPSVTTLTAPLDKSGSGAPLPTSRSTDLVVSFTGGSGKVRAGINGKDASGGSLNVVCTFATSTLNGVIPASALGRFAPGEATFGADTVEEAPTVAGNFDLDVRVLVGVATTAGSSVPSKLMLQ